MHKDLAPSDFDRFHHLAGIFFDGSITEDEALELMKILQSNTEQRQWFFRQFGTDYTLRLMEKARSETLLTPPWIRNRFQKGLVAGSKPLEQDEDLLPTEVILAIKELDIDEIIRMVNDAVRCELQAKFEENKTKVAVGHKETLRKIPKKRRSLVSWLLGGIVCLALGVVYYHELPPNDPSPESQAITPLARIMTLADPVFPDGDTIFKRGQLLGEDVIRLDAGIVEIRVNNGVRIILEGPAEFKLNSEMNAFCRLGRLSVTVPPAGKGFEVASPKLTARDLGTEFVLNVSEDKAEAHVITGKIAVNWLAKEWFELEENRGIRSAETVERITVDRTQFMTSQRLKRLVEAYEARQTKRQREVHEHWDKDPSLRFRFIAGQDGAAIRYGGKLVNGSKPGLRAFALRHQSDRIQAEIPGEMTAMTLIAHVRLDQWNRTNTLFSCRKHEKAPDQNGLFWQIDRSGRLQFLIGKIENGKNRVVSFDSPPLTKETLCDVWVTLAMIVDPKAGTITHCLDGRRVAVIPISESNPFMIDRFSIGNDFDEKKSSLSFWGGAIESFHLFDRPFTHQEIAEFSVL